MEVEGQLGKEAGQGQKEWLLKQAREPVVVEGIEERGSRYDLSRLQQLSEDARQKIIILWKLDRSGMGPPWIRKAHETLSKELTLEELREFDKELTRARGENIDGALPASWGELGRAILTTRPNLSLDSLNFVHGVVAENLQRIGFTEEDLEPNDVSLVKLLETCPVDDWLSQDLGIKPVEAPPAKIPEGMPQAIQVAMAAMNSRGIEPTPEELIRLISAGLASEAKAKEGEGEETPAEREARLRESVLLGWTRFREVEREGEITLKLGEDLAQKVLGEKAGELKVTIKKIDTGGGKVYYHLVPKGGFFLVYAHPLDDYSRSVDEFLFEDLVGDKVWHKDFSLFSRERSYFTRIIQFRGEFFRIMPFDKSQEELTLVRVKPVLGGESLALGLTDLYEALQPIVARPLKG